MIHVVSFEQSFALPRMGYSEAGNSLGQCDSLVGREANDIGVRIS